MTTEAELNSLLDKFQRDENNDYDLDYWDYENPNPYEWAITLRGPNDSPYEGGYFLAKIIFPKDYPNSRPEFYFKTKIYHCNVRTSDGNCCFGNFKGKSIDEALDCFCTFFSSQNPNSAYNSEAAEEHKKGTFYNTARKWTDQYAKLDNFTENSPSNFPN